MDGLRKTFLTHQPGKALWTLFSLAVNAIRLPIWLLIYMPSFMRPHPKWSYRQAVLVRIVRAWLWNAAIVAVKTPLSITADKEKERWVRVGPAPGKCYTGVASQDREPKAQQVGGTWYPAAPTRASKPGYVVMHFHGGAFAIGTGRTSEMGFTANTFLANTPATHVFAPEYRLSSNPGGKFPAALQDAISAYHYLLNDLDIPASKIVVSGDSAGGNLALALIRYIHDNGEKAGLPELGCAWLWSPWADPAGALDTTGMAKSPNNPTDYLTAGFGKWGADELRPALASGIGLDHPNIAFLGNAFATKTPLYISTGEAEILLHDDIRLYEEFKAIKGNKVELQIEEYAPHDIILTAKMIGFEKEAATAAKRAGKYLQSL